MNCSQCGSEVGQDAGFCARCGTPLAGHASQQGLHAAQPFKPAQPGGARSYQFDAGRWTLDDKIIGGATLLVLIALFLPWFDVNLGGLGTLGVSGGNASASGTTAHGWLWFVFVIGLVMLLYLLAVAGFQRLPIELPLKHERLLLIGAGINLLLVIIAFLLKPGNSGFSEVKIGWDFGAFVALIAAIAAVAPLARAAAAERKALGPAR